MRAQITLLVFMGVFLIMTSSSCQRAHEEKVSVPNPAAENCLSMGNEYFIVKTSAGEVGLCKSPEGAVCDAWELYRGECSFRTTKMRADACGGIAGFICPPGFACRISETYPDAMGTCERAG
ncbi:DUF333 domain-containing protein [Candidatus Woesearchaeota archaeon]|nr:MAG: DUF333 domain-containing protein [Candidatus Woesearchaeota archaeon]